MIRAAEQNPLRGSCHVNRGRRLHAWRPCLDVHHRHFARIRGQPVATAIDTVDVD